MASPQRAQIQLEATKCMKAFMNNKTGLNAALLSERALNLLARSLHSTNRDTVLEVLRLLAAVCLLPPAGHMLTLEALTSLVIDDPDEGFRFRRLVEIVQSSDSAPLQVRTLLPLLSVIVMP